MRWDIFFFAGGAVLTALAVKYADKPWLWDGTIYIGGAVMDVHQVGTLAIDFSLQISDVAADLGTLEAKSCVRFGHPPEMGAGKLNSLWQLRHNTENSLHFPC